MKGLNGIVQGVIVDFVIEQGVSDVVDSVDDNASCHGWEYVYDLRAEVVV